MTSIAIDLADGLSSTTAHKGPCKVATTANITLSGEQTIDGAAIVTGDRVLVRAQTTTAENGIYVADTGPWRRAKDFAGNRDVRKGSRVWVTEGDSGPAEYEVTTENPVVVGEDAIGFGPGAITEAAVGPIVQANVPIYAARAPLSVPATVSAYRVNGALEAGDLGKALFKEVGAEPSHAGKDQTPDGKWWEIAEAVVTPQMLKVISDGGASVQTATVQAWLNTCYALDKPAICLSPMHVKIDDTLTFPVTRDIDLQCMAITYAGTRNRSAIYVPSGNSRVMKFGIVQGSTIDWATSDDYVGIYLKDLNNCEVHLNLTRRFTVGYGLFGDTSGCAYNRIYPGILRDNKYCERLKSLTAGGFVNENVFYSGNYGETSAAAALGVAYGTHIAAAPGGYNGHNNNRWISPNYEMGGSAGVNRVPFFFDGAGGNNTCHDARAEACFGPLVICNGSNVRNNEIGFSFASTAVSGQLNTVQEVNGANANRLTGRTGGEARRTFDNLHRLLSSDGTAVGGYVRGDVFLMESTGGTAKRTATFAGRVSSNALGLDLAASCAVMVAVDTSRIKQWRLTPAYAGAPVGTVLAIAFGADGARLTGDATDVTYGNEKYIKNQSGGWSDTASWGGGYSAVTFNGGLFSVRPEVKTMWIGLAGSATVSSFELTGFWTTETLDNTAGLQSISTWAPLNDDGSERLASAKPDTLGEHGYYSKGQILLNSGAGSGQPLAWQCTTAGWLAAAWAISTAYTKTGRIVTNDTGKMYQLVTAGTSAGSGGPTGTGSAITDGTCVWNYVGVKAAFQAITSSGDLLAANNLSDLADAPTARTNLGLEIGADVQAYANTPQTVASLPAAASSSGVTLFVSDALDPVFGKAVVGGGAVIIPVYSNGTSWMCGASVQQKEAIPVAVTDETTAITTGTGKIKFRMPYAMTVTTVKASLNVAQTSGSIVTVDINEAGSTILSTKLTINNGETTSTAAGTTPAVISDATLGNDAEITVDIDQVGDGTAIGLKITLIGYRT